ncbi:MAG: LysM peptidoglycan-binding domain-containing protein [Chloroflexi bacterium]|nr:LysM peptidoglycan-binding domain-containing protein [Chloroflexota bacterium]
MHPYRQTGETIYSISVQYGIPAQALADANNLQSPYVIYPGQTLVIPGAG